MRSYIIFIFLFLTISLIGQQIPLQQNLLQHVASPYANSITDDVNPQNTRVDSIFKGRCYNFDGVDDYIRIDDADVLSVVNQDASKDTSMTICVWLKLDILNEQRIAAKTSGSAKQWIFGTGGSQNLSLIIYEPPGPDYIRAFKNDISEYQNKWAHYACTYDGSRLSSGIEVFINADFASDGKDEYGDFSGSSNQNYPLNIGTYNNF